MLVRKAKSAIRRAVGGLIEPLLNDATRSVRDEIAARLAPVDERIVANPYLSGKVSPYGGARADHIVLRNVPADREDGLPVPPVELWQDYAVTKAEFLATGRADVATMLGILGRDGRSGETLARVLDLGCGAGRMLRFFPADPERSELWGVDVDANFVVWCQQHLGPPMNFATITTSPHLPFEDNYFDLVYCASVFTHISDLADAWFAEVRRVVREGGYAYVTIHDKHTLDLLFTEYKDRRGFVDFVEQLRRFDERTNVRSLDYASFAVGADPYSQVFYDIDALLAKWSRLMTVVSTTEEAHDHQTAVLFRK
jgi:SAM-dependent methyltransferase